MNKLLKNWDMMRVIRLVAGLGLGLYAVVSKDYLFFFLSAFFLIQGVFNISCCGCGSGECSSSSSQKPKQLYKNEIKQYKND